MTDLADKDTKPVQKQVIMTLTPINSDAEGELVGKGDQEEEQEEDMDVGVDETEEE